jgi:hypothetical protein
LKRLLLCSICAALSVMTADAVAGKNQNGAWTLHYAGSHDSEGNTCGFEVVDCVTQLEVNAPPSPGRYDIYVIATNVYGIAQSRFGIECDEGFVFYGWTSCADSEVPSQNWPGCGEGVTLNWGLEQPPGNVTMGILDVYSYGAPSFICASTDPRVGYAEWCDGTTPTPFCFQTTDIWRFGCIGFGQPGYQNCPPPLLVNETTWGRVKALYRE